MAISIETIDATETKQPTQGYIETTSFSSTELPTGPSPIELLIISMGVLIALFGLLLILTPFSQLVRRFLKNIFPATAAVSVVVLGLIGSLIIGWGVSFSQCFKQSCSPLIESLGYTLPIASFFITLPTANLIIKKRHKLIAILARTPRWIWVIVGAGIVYFSLVAMLIGISS